MAGNCKLATWLQTKKSMWEMRKVPQLLGSLDLVMELWSADSKLWILESGVQSLVTDSESGVWFRVWSLESDSESGV